MNTKNTKKANVVYVLLVNVNINVVNVLLVFFTLTSLLTPYILPVR